MYEKMCRSPDPVAEFSVIPISPTSDARSVFSLVVTSFLNLELGACMLLMYSKKLIQPQYSALHDFGFLSQIPNFSTNYLFFPFHEKKFFFFIWEFCGTKSFRYFNKCSVAKLPIVIFINVLFCIM